jgi:pimeloyl-ACP methyl ester carboxylesterase
MTHTMEATYQEPAPLKVPQPAETADLPMSDGAVIRLRRYGEPGRLRIMLSHGNGLAINAYLPFWEPLIEAFELVLFDMRNHGENPRHDPRQHNWERMTQDISEIYAGTQRRFGEAPTVGAFHSLSSVATLFAAIEGGPPWRALALFDPPIFPHRQQPRRRATKPDGGAYPPDLGATAPLPLARAVRGPVEAKPGVPALGRG